MASDSSRRDAREEHRALCEMYTGSMDTACGVPGPKGPRGRKRNGQSVEEMKAMDKERRETIKAMESTGTMMTVLDQMGTCPQPNPCSGNWNELFNAVIYVWTLFTTIGWGSFTTATSPGKAMVVLFSVVGLPLYWVSGECDSKGKTRIAIHTCPLFLFSSALPAFLAIHLSYPFTFHGCPFTFHTHSPHQCANEELVAIFRRPMQKIAGVRPDDDTGEVTYNLTTRLRMLMAVLTVLTLYVIVGGGYMMWLFSCTNDKDDCVAADNWSFIDGVWFAFISLTTIGFGDKSMNVNRGDLGTKPYHLLAQVVYLSVGLALVAEQLNLLTTIGEDLVQKTKAVARKISMRGIRESVGGSTGRTSNEVTAMQKSREKKAKFVI
jgi:hypothetical protein